MGMRPLMSGSSQALKGWAWVKTKASGFCSGHDWVFGGGDTELRTRPKSYLPSTPVNKGNIPVGEIGACWLWGNLTHSTSPARYMELKQIYNIKCLPSSYGLLHSENNTWRTKGAQLGSIPQDIELLWQPTLECINNCNVLRFHIHKVWCLMA